LTRLQRSKTTAINAIKPVGIMWLAKDSAMQEKRGVRMS